MSDLPPRHTRLGRDAQTSVPHQLLDHEGFLSAPALFRFGPLALVVFAVLFALILVPLGEWRIQKSRSIEYEKALDTVEASAIKVRDSLGQAVARIRHSAKLIDQAPIETNDDRRRLEAILTMPGVVSYAAATSSSGSVIAAAGDFPDGAGLVASALDEARSKPLVAGTDAMLRAVTIHGRTVLPFVVVLDHGRALGRAVFLIDANTLTNGVRKDFGAFGGWLRIADGDHRLFELLRTATSESAASPAPASISTTAASALKQPLNYTSTRLLVRDAPADASALTFTVGLTERWALLGAEERVKATWALIFFGAGVVFVLCGLTAWAIRQFAQKEAYLRRLATIDALTGLPNRRSFFTLLDRAVKKSAKTRRGLALLMIDLDNFKFVNDSAGHAKGDSLLQHVAVVLLGGVGSDVSVCRLGGDEFTVIVEGLSGPGQAVQIAEALLERVKSLARVDGVALRTRASIGIATMPEHATSAEGLMQFADTAMYRAKASGKCQCVLYDPTMAEAALARAELIQDLEVAVATGDLHLVYQPKFSMLTGTVTGYEALVRWRHERRGLVSPAEFIPAAESSGLILELGTWVMREAMRQVREWFRADGRWRHVAVNVSAVQLCDETFILLVRDLLAEFQMPGSCLQLEITESAIARDVEGAKALLTSIRRLGVTVAIDDFGTGYSSLGSLQQFELDTLKLDISFVSKVHTPAGRAVCQAVVKLAHALNMQVIAEGVETVQQGHALFLMGCDEVQGYLMARPVLPTLALDFERAPKRSFELDTRPLSISTDSAGLSRRT